VTHYPTLIVIAMAMLAVAAATPSFAQATGAPQDPFAGTARETPNANAREALDLSMSLITAYNSDGSIEAPAAVNQLFGLQSIARSNQLHGNASYRWEARDVQLRATGTTAWIQDRRSGAVSGLSHTAGGDLTARLPLRTTLVVNQTASYSPSYLYNLFPRAAGAAPGDVPPAARDYEPNDLETYSYGAQATLTHNATRRTNFSFSAIGEYALTDTRGTTATRGPAAGQSELGAYGLSGRFTRAMTRTMRANGRYFYRAGNFPDASVTATGATTAQALRITEHGVEVGLAATRPLSATRQIVLEVALGGSSVMPVEPVARLTRRAPTNRMIGMVGVNYLFSKSWQAGAMYRRRVDYVPGLVEPVLTDGYGGRIGGSFTRRIDMVVEAAYASAAPALNRGGAAFDTYTSNAKLRVAVNEAVAVYGEYLYYLYDFRRYAPVMPGMPPALERNGLRFGVTLIVPSLTW
jgi:hypothetical protein